MTALPLSRRRLFALLGASALTRWPDGDGIALASAVHPEALYSGELPNFDVSGAHLDLSEAALDEGMSYIWYGSSTWEYGEHRGWHIVEEREEEPLYALRA